MSEINLNEFHNVLLELLVEFDRICRKQNIKYSLAYGTLIGAVRHKGFIPWDDDVDVMLTRKEYKRFCQACLKELDNKFFLQTKITEPDYPYNIARIRKNDTTMIYDKWEKAGFHQGIYIDIYPIDNIPDNKFKRFVQKWSIIMLTPIRITSNKVIYFNGGTSSNKRLKNILYYILRCFPRKVCGKIEDRVIEKYNSHKTSKSSLICEGQLLLHPSKDTTPFDNDIMEQYTELDFDGHKFMSVEKYHDLLILLYGDYMQLPPEDKRGMFHNPKVYDTGKSYLEYIN